MLISLASAVGLAILFWMGCCYLVYRFMPRRRQRLAIQAADRAEAEDKAEMRREVAPPPRVRLNFTRAHGVDAADFAAPSRPVTANEMETMPIEDLEGEEDAAAPATEEEIVREAREHLLAARVARKLLAAEGAPAPAAADPPTITLEEMDEMKVGELREALEERGLSTDGKKKELQARLRTALEEELEAAAPAEELVVEAEEAAEDEAPAAKKKKGKKKKKGGEDAEDEQEMPKEKKKNKKDRVEDPEAG